MTREVGIPFVDPDYQVRGTPFIWLESPLVVGADGMMLAVALVRHRPPLKVALVDLLEDFYWYEEDYWKDGTGEDFLWRHEEGMELKGLCLNGSSDVSATVFVESSSVYFLESLNMSNVSVSEASDEGTWKPFLGIHDFDKGNETGEPFHNISEKASVGLNFFRPGSPPYLNNVDGFSAYAGTAIVTKDRALLFPVQVRNKEQKDVSLVIYSNHHETHWKTSEGTLPEGCIHPAVVEWEGKLVMMTSCEDGLRKVYESADMGKTWKEAFGSLSRVWGNTEGRYYGHGNPGGFITAEIDGKKVMLFIQPLTCAENKCQFYLWLTDGNRILNVGLILLGGQETVSSTLLYIHGKLFALYKTYYDTHSSIFLKRLVFELVRIKTTLRVWDERDKCISGHCCSSSDEAAVFDDSCATTPTPMPTAGLVGLLSNNGDDAYWADEYLCVNATVRNAKKIPNGFEFSGRGSGAQWPVGKLGQNQQYHFANYEFTLVATVTIHAVPRHGSSLLGVALGGAGGVTHLGLWCDKKRRWKAVYGIDGESYAGTWEPNKTYQVVFTLQNGILFLYVDGELLLGLSTETQKTKNGDSDGISHFFFGADGHGALSSSNSHVAITNVFLYNRQLSARDFRWSQSGPVKMSRAPALGVVGSAAGPTASDRNELAPGQMSDGGAMHRGVPRIIFFLLGLLGLSALYWAMRRENLISYRKNCLLRRLSSGG